MKAIIYAAGRGTRLQSDSPKILLEFGGRTLLEWHALRLRAAEVREVVLVTGHLREQIAELLPDICARHDIAVREIVNPRFRRGEFAQPESLASRNRKQLRASLVDGRRCVLSNRDARPSHRIGTPHRITAGS